MKKYTFNLINASGLIVDTKLSASIQSVAQSFKKVWEVTGCTIRLSDDDINNLSPCDRFYIQHNYKYN